MITLNLLKHKDKICVRQTKRKFETSRINDPNP